MAADNEMSGHAARYTLAADLWRTRDFKLSGTAGFGLASADYAVNGIDLAADRAVHEFGGSIDWGSMHQFSTRTSWFPPKRQGSRCDSSPARCSTIRCARWRTWTACRRLIPKMPCLSYSKRCAS